MSPTPVTFVSPDGAERLHLGGHRRGGRRALRRRPRPDRPLRPQHVPGPARARARGSSPPAGSRPASPSTRRPTTGGSSRRRRPATASTPDEILVGAGADEILDLIAKAFLPARRRGRRPDPDVRDVPRPHRAARRRGRRGPAARPGAGLGARRRRRPRGGRRTPPSSGCAARTTRPRCPSPTARSSACSTGLAADAGARRASGPDRRPRRGLRRVRRAVAPRACGPPTRTSSSSGRPARPMRWPGCGSGSRSPIPRSSPG